VPPRIVLFAIANRRKPIRHCPSQLFSFAADSPARRYQRPARCPFLGDPRFHSCTTCLLQPCLRVNSPPSLLPSESWYEAVSPASSRSGCCIPFLKSNSFCLLFFNMLAEAHISRHNSPRPRAKHMTTYKSCVPSFPNSLVYESRCLHP